MPLGGTGNILGSLLAGAVGAPSAVGSFFATLGGVVAAWAPANIQVKPTAMAAASGSVSGTGKFSVVGEALDLGNAICDALTIPPNAPDARAVWIKFADAFISHLETYGVANGTGLTSGAPCGGAGKVTFSSPVFVPPLAVTLAVTHPVSAAGLESFAAGFITHIQANAAVVGLSLSGPPLSAPADGPVTGTGTIS